MKTVPKITRGLAVAAALSLSACATVTVKQEKPIEINVRVDLYEHAEQVVDDLITPLPKKEKPKSAAEPAGGPQLVTAQSQGGAERSLEEIKNAIRGRAEGVRALKSAGAIGEKNDGYIAVVDASKGKKAAGVVAAENADRKDLYKADAAGQGKSLAEVERAYASVWRKKAQPGDWIEQDGKWTRK